MDVKKEKEVQVNIRTKKLNAVYLLSIVTLIWSIIVRELVIYFIGVLLFIYSTWKKFEVSKSG